MHPEYASSRLVSNWLSQRETAPFPINSIENVISIQHHFAHVVSCMAENQINKDVIGVAFDGTGYGIDGNIWGGEFLICSLANFSRIGSIKEVKMPGGNSAIGEPWRMALSYLLNVDRSHRRGRVLERLVERFGKKSVSDVTKVAESPLSTTTTSCGRLFDAIASLTGICDINQYEGHAPVMLQREAENFRQMKNLTPGQLLDIQYSVKIQSRKSVSEKSACDGAQPYFEIDTSPMVEEVLNDLAGGKGKGEIAAKFHDWTAMMILEVCKLIRDERALTTVCMSGGVFQNRLLLETSAFLLAEAGFQVHWNSRVPTNDGGLSLGQATAALAQIGMLEPCC
jgi:hydrogenase maturation protein HypF